jgi:hypothetical protein
MEKFFDGNDVGSAGAFGIPGAIANQHRSKVSCVWWD